MMNLIFKTFGLLVLFSFVVLVFHFLLEQILTNLNHYPYFLLILIQFVLSLGVFLILNTINKKQADNLGYYFLFTSTVKSILLYLIISYFLFTNISLTFQYKLLLSIDFMLFLGLDVYLTARLLNSKH